jgi:hypothetical protein
MAVKLSVVALMCMVLSVYARYTFFGKCKSVLL